MKKVNWRERKCSRQGFYEVHNFFTYETEFQKKRAIKRRDAQMPAPVAIVNNQTVGVMEKAGFSMVSGEDAEDSAGKYLMFCDVIVSVCSLKFSLVIFIFYAALCLKFHEHRIIESRKNSFTLDNGLRSSETKFNTCPILNKVNSPKGTTQ